MIWIKSFVSSFVWCVQIWFVYQQFHYYSKTLREAFSFKFPISQWSNDDCLIIHRCRRRFTPLLNINIAVPKHPNLFFLIFMFHNPFSFSCAWKGRRRKSLLSVRTALQSRLSIKWNKKLKFISMKPKNRWWVWVI